MEKGTGGFRAGNVSFLDIKIQFSNIADIMTELEL